MEMILIQRSEFEALIEDKLRYAILNYMPRPSIVQPQVTEPEFLTKKQVAKMLSCGVTTVDNYRQNGKLKAYYLGLKKDAVRFKKSEVLELVENNN